MSYFIAVAPIDPAANELRGFVRDTQEAAEAMAAQNTRPNQPWSVYELVLCANVETLAPKLSRIKEPVAADALAAESQPAGVVFWGSMNPEPTGQPVKDQ